MVSSAPDTRQAIDRAIAWHSTAPIRVVDPQSPSRGAFRHGYDAGHRRPLGVYTEITGYGVSLFVFLNRAREDRRFLDVAEEAGDFLLRIQGGDGSFPDSEDPANFALPRRHFSFDTAACVVGLARLARSTGHRRHAEAAARAGPWLLRMQRPDGSFCAMTDNERRLEDPGGFFGDGSCIHAKNAIALLQLHALTGEDRYREAASRCCDHTISLQDGDGAFFCTARRDEVFTHAHAYACEGLIYAGRALGESLYVAAAERGARWLQAAQRRAGGWPAQAKLKAPSRGRVLDTLVRPLPADAAAQAVRLFALLGSEFEEARRRGLRFLAGFQARAGGFAYRRTRLGYSSMLYTWPTQFAIQAFTWDGVAATINDLF
ncbi:MAG: terpene cyclase/mutase family protein [Acidobacteria bacterium]|nr:terpene cyclase/mutase family protein [Acidobacteriota bacterium]